MHTVLVLGGYGFFGRRIAADLAGESRIRLMVGGRCLEKGEALCAALGLPRERAVALDASALADGALLRDHGVDTLVHTAGPFQAQDHGVARAAIDAGCNYIDLADGRHFVAGIGVLDEKAKARRVTVISGASSVPGLSSAVVERYREAFSSLESIRIGISSGGRAPGIATVLGVFGYCGKAIRRLENGCWTETHGWLDLIRYRFPSPVGSRLLGSCDVPDLDLFPARYPSVKTVTFHAGFANAPGHLLVWLLAVLVRHGMLDDLRPWARPLNRISRWMESISSDKGAMFVELGGIGLRGEAVRKRWHLIAQRNHGPHIPCGASIALVRRLAYAAPLPHGAMPCVGLVRVEEYLASLSKLDIRVVE